MQWSNGSLSKRALLLPLVDLVQEGLQYVLNGDARLGFNIRDQLLVALAFVLLEYSLEQNDKQNVRLSHGLKSVFPTCHIFSDYDK